MGPWLVFELNICRCISPIKCLLISPILSWLCRLFCYIYEGHYKQIRLLPGNISDKANTFGKYWLKWWTNISELDISNFDPLEECVLFGFPSENKIFKVINFCILIAKYYIYIQKLINSNKIDFFDYLAQLKQKLQIEKIICVDEGNPSKFEQFEFILDNI